MKPSHVLFAIAALGSGANAQAFTSPAGLDLVEGNSSQSALFGATPRRFQQVDATAVAAGARSLSSIAWRRDGDRATPSALARTMDLQIMLGHGSTTAAPVATFAANYLTAPTVVFATRSVSMPDWSAQQVGPAAFDFAVTFDTPFAYNGTDALVWDIVVTNSSSLGTVFTDRQLATTPFGYHEGVRTANGCVVGGQAQMFECSLVGFNWGDNHPTLGQRLVVSASYAPANAPIVIDICLDTTPIPVPGLCAPFLADLIVSFGIGSASPTGFSTDFTIDVNYNPVLDGVPIAAQALTLDATQPGLPFAFSDVKSAVIPMTAQSLECSYLYGGPGSTTGTVFPDRGVIVLFQ